MARPSLFFAFALALALVLTVLLAAGPAAAADTMSASEAFERASRGEIVLVDIRAPAEWRETGIASVAEPISMHEPGFLDRLERAVGGNRARRIALICATGGRSAWLRVQLLARGFRNVADVAEGMAGGRQGAGWIRAGLPVRRIAN